MGNKFSLNLGKGILEGLEDIEKKIIEDGIRIEPISYNIIQEIDFEDTSLTNRIDIDNEKIQELSDSIKSIGLLNPILLKESSGKKKYKVIAGYRRATALNNLYKENKGIKIIGNVTIYNEEKLSLLQLEQISFEENHKRENLKELEISLAIKKLSNYLDNETNIDEEIMKIFNIKNRVEYLRLKEIVEKYPNILIEKLEEIGFTKAKEIYQFVNKYVKYKGLNKDDEYINKIVRELASKEVTKEELRDKIKELKNKDFNTKENVEKIKAKIGKNRYEFSEKQIKIIEELANIDSANLTEVEIIEEVLKRIKN